MTDSSLSKSLTLACGAVLPNRLVKAAMTEGLADEYGRSTDLLCNVYKRWSEGGCGLLITGNVQIDRRYIERPGNVCIDGEQDGEQLERLNSYAKAGQTHGSKIFVQISHGGRQSNGMINMSPVGPGDIPIDLPRTHFGIPRALSVEEILEVKNRFVNAAIVCKSCGFDGVQIHSAHGYLLSSFLNPRANNRVELFGESDQYGGSIENRARLLLDVVRSVRAAVGPSFAIAVKLNSADFQEGGFSAEEAVEVACMLEKESIDLLEISGGNYEAGIYQEAVDNEKNPKKESTKKREAYFLAYALEVKKSLKNLPVMVTGGWRGRVNMEEAISSNECSLIGLGRPLCGDPDGAKKLLDGSIDSLPRYEQSLQTFHWSLQWIFMLPFQLTKMINMIGQQTWYYCNIVSLAETGKPSLDKGCFASFLANNAREENLAKTLKGDVKCKGTIHAFKGNY